MPPLVTYQELCDFLDIEYGTDKSTLEPLLVQATTLFEKACGREQAPFGGPLTGRTEITRAEPWATVHYLDYPVATLTSVALGQDVNAPDEVLTPASASSVVWIQGSREITRTDGGHWARGCPRWIKVVYDTLADLPGDAKLAVKRRVATVYQLRGKEGFSQITRGARSWSMADLDADNRDAFWHDAVQNNLRGWIR